MNKKNNKTKIIYYAHHMSIYNRKVEKDELKTISNLLKNSIIINPNGWIYKFSDGDLIMKQCFQIIKNVDILIFSTIEDNIIGKGVHDEIECAYKNNKEIFLLDNNKLIKYDKNKINIELINYGTLWKKYAKVTY